MHRSYTNRIHRDSACQSGDHHSIAAARDSEVDRPRVRFWRSFRRALRKLSILLFFHVVLQYLCSVIPLLSLRMKESMRHLNTVPLEGVPPTREHDFLTFEDEL